MYVCVYNIYLYKINIYNFIIQRVIPCPHQPPNRGNYTVPIA